MMPPSMRRTSWGILAALGYLLSPLSWWNDLWINIPIAYAAANLVHSISGKLFLPVFTIVYWITNILGLVLLHIGAQGTMTGHAPDFSRTGIIQWIGVSLAYTVGVVMLVELGILRPVDAYF